MKKGLFVLLLAISALLIACTSDGTVKEKWSDMTGLYLSVCNEDGCLTYQVGMFDYADCQPGDPIDSGVEFINDDGETQYNVNCSH